MNEDVCAWPNCTCSEMSLCASAPDAKREATNSWKPVMGPSEYRFVLSNVRRIMPRKLSKVPNWVLAKKVFGNGRTYSVMTCNFAEIDPDGFSSERIRNWEGTIGHPDFLDCGCAIIVGCSC